MALINGDSMETSELRKPLALCHSEAQFRLSEAENLNCPPEQVDRSRGVAGHRFHALPAGAITALLPIGRTGRFGP
jgi:hypothetical protein